MCAFQYGPDESWPEFLTGVGHGYDIAAGMFGERIPDCGVEACPYFCGFFGPGRERGVGCGVGQDLKEFCLGRGLEMDVGYTREVEEVRRWGGDDEYAGYAWDLLFN